ncbi:MAG: hypothetical protein E7424_01045 [Ruminococcaceae bacterium]|nr:hypothetical protein [Oscillospiraceae bacterium]
MTDWLMVIITAVYVVATIIICVFNGKSAKAAREQTDTAKRQIEEMITQYNELNRPVVTIRFDIIRSGLLCFVVENTGPVAASDVQIRINDEFLNNIKDKKEQDSIREITKARLFLSSHQKVFFCLGGQQVFSEIASQTAKIDISYNGKYDEHTEIDLWQYRHLLLYSSELEDISQHLKKLETENKSFHDKFLKENKRTAPISVLIHNDDSKKFALYKAVCMNPGATAKKLAEIVGVPAEEALNILLELDQVDRFIFSSLYAGDDFDAKWYRR